MDKDKVLEIIERYGMSLAKYGARPDKIVLFGSHANGNAREESDIDLIVISRDFEGMDFWQRIKILSQGIAEIWEPIEAIAMTPEEWASGDSMIAQFARSGEVAYSA